jgi:hypothetical protein
MPRKRTSVCPHEGCGQPATIYQTIRRRDGTANRLLLCDSGHKTSSDAMGPVRPYGQKAHTTKRYEGLLRSEWRPFPWTLIV